MTMTQKRKQLNMQEKSKMNDSCVKIVVDSINRLDKIIVDKLEGFSRSAVQNIFEKGFVTDKNGTILNKKAKMPIGSTIIVNIPEAEEIDIKPEDISLEIIFEDNDLLVVNKPKGMVVHPAPGHSGGTLVNALMFHCKDSLSGINGIIRPGIVHRIDKDTSGLLIVAKNDSSHTFLAEQIQNHSFEREYQAIVYGRVKQDKGTVSTYIGRHPLDRKKMAIMNDESRARHAVTHFEVIEAFSLFSHLRLRLETGRTHQIRVHMAHLGHPVAGDPVYGPKKIITSLDGQCLHAGLIGFIHPRTKEKLVFEAPLPEYFKKFLNKINR